VLLCQLHIFNGVSFHASSPFRLQTIDSASHVHVVRSSCEVEINIKQDIRNDNKNYRKNHRSD
ncbi:MAG: hypothetical protein KA957_00735, partial [Syntrophaceae bacterium]|nr:hypothetical protein [Syntrophaceae bacterium]